jgi:hypothetical protein
MVLCGINCSFEMEINIHCGDSGESPTAASARSRSRLRWGTSTAASSRRSAAPSPRSSPDSSSSVHFSLPITTVRTAKPVIRPPVNTRNSSTPHRHRCCQSHPRTVPWWPHRMSLRTTWSRACWQPPTSWAPAGSPPTHLAQRDVAFVAISLAPVLAGECRFGRDLR